VPATIAILGGTGAEGSALAARFVQAGARVRIGSRDLQKAQRTAERLGSSAEGLLYADAVLGADVVILTVPLQAQISTLKAVRANLQPGAIVVDATVPLEAAVGGRLAHPLTLWAGSAAQQAARHVPAGVSVVAAFHCLSAELLEQVDRPVDCDVLLCGDNDQAKSVVRQVAEMIPGVRVVDAGPLENARMVETAAALLIALNLKHKVKHSGMRITGLEPTR
jgi:hypothetical protein